MSRKSGQAASQKSGSGLLDAVRQNLTTRRPGFRPWYERVAPEVADELNELREQWRAGKLGTKCRPVAEAVMAHLHEHKLADIGLQGVLRWLDKKD